MNKNRTSSRLARRQTKNSEKTADIVNGTTPIWNQNGQPIDDIDLIFGNIRSKFYPIYTPINKKVNTHNLAQIPSLQLDEDSLFNDNTAQTNEYNEKNNSLPKHKKRKNANVLIEAKNKFRQLINQTLPKNRVNANSKNESSAFDGYELKNRRVKYEPRKLRKENNNSEQTSPIKISSNDYTAKIAEKTIDLSNFCRMNPNQYIPLYPLCRHWALTNYGIPESLKHKRNYPPPPLIECPDPDGPYSKNPIDVWHLPKPDPLPLDCHGNPIILRIPKRIREGKFEAKEPDTSFINSKKDLSGVELLKLNMPYWKKCRRENVYALQENRRRFRHSFAVLRSMFDRSSGKSYCDEIAFYKYPPYEPYQNDQSQQQQQSPTSLPQQEQKEQESKSPQEPEINEPTINLQEMETDSTMPIVE